MNSNASELLSRAYEEAGVGAYNLLRLASDVGDMALFCLQHPKIALPILFVISSTILDACGATAPIETKQPPTENGSNNGESQPNVGNGTAVPEVTLTPGAITNIKEIFGIDASQISTVGLGCNSEQQICVMTAFDEKQNPVSQSVLFNSGTSQTGESITVNGFSFGGTAVFTDKDNNGAVDQVFISGRGDSDPTQVANALKWVNGEDKNKLDEVLNAAHSSGKDVFLNTISEGNTLTITVEYKKADGTSNVWTSRVNMTETGIKDANGQAAKLVSPSVSTSDGLELRQIPADWMEVGNHTFVAPKFVSMQESVAASGQEFTLQPNGTLIAADGTVVTGFVLAANGEYVTMTVNGQALQCTFDPSTIQGETFSVKLPDGTTVNWDATKNEWVKVEAHWDIDRQYFESKAVSVLGSLNDIPMSIKIGFDSSESRVTDMKIKSDSQWRDNETNLGPNEAVMNFFQHYIYKAWKDGNTKVADGLIGDSSFEAYIKIVQEINAGTRSIEDGVVPGYANDLTTEKYDVKKWNFTPFINGGTNSILNFEFVLVHPGRVTNLTKLPPPHSNSGQGINYDPLTNTLTIYEASAEGQPRVITGDIVEDLASNEFMFEHGILPKSFIRELSALLENKKGSGESTPFVFSPISDSDLVNNY